MFELGEMKMRQEELLTGRGKKEKTWKQNQTEKKFKELRTKCVKGKPLYKTRKKQSSARKRMIGRNGLTEGKRH